MEYLKGDRKHPRNIRVRVQDGKHYRPPDWSEGSYGPGTTLSVCEAELAIAGHLIERIDEPATSPARQNRGKAATQARSDAPEKAD